MNFRIGMSLAAGLLSASLASAAPVQWTVASGGNGHWYEAISAPSTSWTVAAAAALAAGGHLATITSAAENAFVADLVPNGGTNNDPYWLGGTRTSTSSDPAAGWGWVTGEAWGYTNWAAGEPNNANGENSLAFAFFGGANTWNNAPTGWTGYSAGGYVVEYELPEPGALALVVAGLAGMTAARRRKA